MYSLDKWIKKIREEKGLNITELSETTGISRPYLSQIESGKRKPSLEVMNEMAMKLDIPLKKFIEEYGFTLD